MTSQPAPVDAVIAEVLDTADANPAGNIADGPAGQDGDGQAVRAIGCDTGQPAQGAPGNRVDPGGHRVELDLGDGPVEIRHDQDPAGWLRGPGHQVVEQAHGLLRAPLELGLGLALGLGDAGLDAPWASAGPWAEASEFGVGFGGSVGTVVPGGAALGVPGARLGPADGLAEGLGDGASGGSAGVDEGLGVGSAGVAAA